MTWEDNSAFESGYVIRRDGVEIARVHAIPKVVISNVFPFLPVTVFVYSPYKDATGEPGRVYDYEVSAYDANGESLPGSDQGSRVLKAPTDVSIFSLFGTAPEAYTLVSWRDNSAIELGYIVRRDGVEIERVGAVEATGRAGGFQDRTGVPGKTYTYAVSAYDANGESASVSINGRRTLKAPTALTAIDGAAVGQEGSVVLNWTDLSSAESGYVVRRDGQEIGRTAADATEFVDPRPAPGQAYTYEVRPYDSAGESALDGAEVTWSEGVLVRATDGDFEDRVEVTWAYLLQDDVTFRISRDDQVLSLASSQDTEYTDRTGVPGVEYSYKVEVIGRDDEVKDQGEALGVRVIQGPTGVKASDGKFDDRVVVRWEDNSQVESGYVVERDGVEIGRTGANARFFKDEEATAGEDVPHNYTVTAFDENDKRSAPGADTEDTGWRGAILPPEMVEASFGLYEGKVVITWQEPAGASSLNYEITRDAVPIVASTPGEAVDLAADPSLRSYTDESPVSQEKHTYCVRTLTEGDGKSVPECAVGGIDILPIPGQVKASDETFDNKVRVTWKDRSEEEDGFEVYRRLSGTGDFVSIKKTAKGITRYNDFSASPGVNYDYRVVAFSDLGGQSQASNIDAGQRSVVLAPENLQATRGDHEDKVELSWESASTTVQYFNLYRSVERVAGLDGNTVLAEELIKTLGPQMRSYVDTGGEAGTEGLEYRYAIKAATQSVADATIPVLSEGTAAIGFKELKAPTDLEASDDAFEDRVVLTWADNSVVETGYNIYRDGNRLGPSDPTVEFNRTSYADLTGEPGKTYAYEVRAFNAEGESAAGVSVDEGRRVLRAVSEVEAGDGAFEDKVAVRWRDNSDIETGYVIYRQSLDADGQGVGDVDKVGEVAADITLFEDSSPVGKARYGVVPKDAFITVLTSLPEADFVGGGQTDAGFAALLAPTEFKASAIYTDKVQLNWVDVSARNTGYRLFRDGTELSTPAADAAHFIDDSAVAGVAYEYCIEAFEGTVVSNRLCAGGQRIHAVADVFYDQKIVAVDPITQLPIGQPDDQFGYSIATDGRWLAVGAPGADRGRGRVYIYELVYQGEAWEWVQRTVIRSPDGLGFGLRVAIDGEQVLVGNKTLTNTVSTVFLFDRDSGQESRRIQSPNGIGPFGQDIALNDHVIVISDFNDAWVYRPNKVPNKLIVEEGEGKIKDVAIDKSGNVFLAISDSKGIAVFARDSIDQADSGADIYKDALWQKGIEEFAHNMSTSNDHLIVGSALWSGGSDGQGQAFVYSPSFIANSSGRRPEWTLSTDNVGDLFGAHVAIDPSGNYMLVATGVNATGERSAAYLFRRSENPDWQKTPIDSFPFTSSQVAREPLAIGNNSGLISDTALDNKTGAVYAVNLFSFVAPPEDLQVSDGQFNNRVQLAWEDRADGEDAYWIFRDGEQIASLNANAKSFADFDAIPGKIYEYCASAVVTGEGESERTCDYGWRPLNGAVAGRVTSQAGAGLEGVQVCLEPVPNGGVQLDGVYGSRVVIDEPVIPGNAFTLEMWLRSDKPSGFRESSPFSYSASIRYLALEAMENLRVRINENSISTGTSLNDGQWHHLAVSWQSADGRLSVYKNGLEVPNSPFSLARGAEISPDGLLSLGQLTGTRFDRHTMLQGQLDEVRIWDRVRTADEIKAAMNLSLTGDEPGLVGYWPFDENDGALVADHSTNNRYGRMLGGAYWSQGSDQVESCDLTDTEGNYALSGIQYGKETTFKVVPIQEDRTFRPAFKKVTLNTDTPVENQVDLIDITTYAVTGRVRYKGTKCSVPGVTIRVLDENGATVRDVVTDQDGRYAAALDKGIYTFEALLEREGVPPHTFEPATIPVVVEDADQAGKNFSDTTTRDLAGFAGGSCDLEVGDLKVEIRSEDECYIREEVVNGHFGFQLPPLRYAVKVLDVENIPAALDRVAVLKFFERLGAVQVDLTEEDQQVDLLYRAPLTVAITGLPAANEQCDATALEDVPIVNQNDNLVLSIAVQEDYGANGFCDLNEGRVTIFDEIGDRGDEGVVVEVKDGQATYATEAKSPSVFVGRKDAEGNNRDYQKAITAIAEVPGLAPASDTQWVLVEGERAREGTDFVTATSDPIPLLILRDPPGDDSYVYIEKGQSITKTFDFDINNVAFSAGLRYVASYGGEGSIGVLGTSIDYKFLIEDETELLIGGKVDEEGKTQITITAQERFATSNSDLFVGERGDVYIGAAFNFLFGRKDKITVNDCQVSRTELIGFEPSGFATTFAYTQAYIEDTLIPSLKQIRGDASGTAQVEVDTTKDVPEGLHVNHTIKLWEAYINQNRALKELAKKGLPKLLETDPSLASIFNGSDNPGPYQLGLSADDEEDLEEDGGVPQLGRLLSKEESNRSFSAGADFEYVYQADVTRSLTRVVSITTAFETENDIFAKFNGTGPDIELKIKEESENVTFLTDITDTQIQAIGYVLSDNDIGDVFTVDIKSDKFYPTPIFDVLAGRSSNPWEPWRDNEGKARMVPRDKAVLSIDPDSRPVGKVPPDEEATFTLLLTNDSQSGEAREYLLRSVDSNNSYGAQLTVNGSDLNGGMSFLLGAQQTHELTLLVARGPRKYNYEGLKLILYSPGEYALWEAGGPGFDGTRSLPPRLSGEVSLDVSFKSPCSDIELFEPAAGWFFNKTNADTDAVQEVILTGYDLEEEEEDPEEINTNPTNPLQRIFVQYRRLGLDRQGPDPWTELEVFERKALLENRPDPDADIGPDNLPFKSQSFDWDVDNLPQDGVYEVRAYTECGDEGRVYSATQTGTIDRLAPKVQGTPQPADGRLSLGEEVSITFDEPISCEALQEENISLVADAGTQGEVAIAPLDWTCDGRTLLLKPSVGWDGLEGKKLTASIANIERADSPTTGIVDLIGNAIAADPSWTFWVRRQAFAWTEIGTQTVPLNQPYSFEATLVNGSSQMATFTLEQPEWLTPRVANVHLAPGTTQVIHFAVVDNLAAGATSGSVKAYAEDLGTAVLNVDLDVACQEPNWVANHPSDGNFVNSASFDHRMNLVADLFIDGTRSTGGAEADLMAAFVGEQLRGVSQVQGSGAASRVPLIVHSNVLEGELVRFEVWDRSACTLYPFADQFLAFADGAFIGTNNAPVVLNALLEEPPPLIANQVVTQQLPLNRGWTWISVNVEDEDMGLGQILSGLFLQPGDRIRSAAQDNTFGAGMRWATDGLQALDPRVGYMIRLQDAATLTIEGTPVDPQTPIPLEPGWNWVGYLPQQAHDINTALAGYEASFGDLFTGQYGFAEYVALNPYEGHWVGSLERLEPGAGYRLLSQQGGTLVYPANELGSEPAAAKMAARRPLVDGEEWHVDGGAYPHSMALQAAFVHQGQALVAEDAWVGAFVGEQLRGVAPLQAVEGADGYRAFVVVHGQGTGDEPVMLKVFDPALDELLVARRPLAFVADAVEGRVEQPVRFVIGNAVPEVFQLAQNVPNPFNPSTEIGYQLPIGGEVSLVVYNVLGQPVRVLQRGVQGAGYYRVVWDGMDGYGQAVGSGVYFYRLEAGGQSQVRRLMLVK